MSKFNVYFNFPGNTEEIFNFYRSVFGGELNIVRFKEMPMPGVRIPEGDENKILHISLQVGKDDFLMASDSLDSLGQKVTMGNNVYVSVTLESKQEADRVFKALSAGGSVEMAMADQPWGDYYGSFKDKYGILWMLSYTYPKTEKQ